VNIDELKKLVAFMRSEGVNFIRYGDIKVRLGPPPAEEDPDEIPAAARRPITRLDQDPDLYPGGAVPQFPNYARDDE